MPTRDAIFIGATIKAADDCDSYFGPVKVPGTMTKQTTIEAHRSRVGLERLAHKSIEPCAFAGTILPADRRYENHTHRPGLAVLSSVCVLGEDGSPLYQQSANGSTERGKVALPLLSYLKENYPAQFGNSLRLADAEPTTIIFGFNIKQVLRIAAFEVLKRNVGAQDFDQVQVPVRLWHNPIGVYDPFDVLLPAADQRDLDLYSMLRYFGLEANVEELTIDASAQAHAVCDLVQAAQLFPPAGVRQRGQAAPC